MVVDSITFTVMPPAPQKIRFHQLAPVKLGVFLTGSVGVE